MITKTTNLLTLTDGIQEHVVRVIQKNNQDYVVINDLQKAVGYEAGSHLARKLGGDSYEICYRDGIRYFLVPLDKFKSVDLTMALTNSIKQDESLQHMLSEIRNGVSQQSSQRLEDVHDSLSQTKISVDEIHAKLDTMSQQMEHLDMFCNALINSLSTITSLAEISKTADVVPEETNQQIDIEPPDAKISYPRWSKDIWNIMLWIADANKDRARKLYGMFYNKLNDEIHYDIDVEYTKYCTNHPNQKYNKNGKKISKIEVLSHNQAAAMKFTKLVNDYKSKIAQERMKGN